MDKVLDTCHFQLVHASGSAGYDEHGAAVQGLESGNCIFRIFIIARTENHNIGFSRHCSFHTFLYGRETEVVNNFISGTGQEVTRVLGTCLTHSQVADSQHKCFGTLAGRFRFQTQRFKFAGCTVEVQ